jgi:hypothetical protein
MALGGALIDVFCHLLHPRVVFGVSEIVIQTEKSSLSHDLAVSRKRSNVGSMRLRIMLAPPTLDGMTVRSQVAGALMSDLIVRCLPAVDQRAEPVMDVDEA